MHTMVPQKNSFVRDIPFRIPSIMQNVFGIKKVMQLLCSNLTVKYYKIVSDKCCDVHKCRFILRSKTRRVFFQRIHSQTQKKVSILSKSVIFIVQFGQPFLTDRNFQCLFNLKLKVKVNSKYVHYNLKFFIF